MTILSSVSPSPLAVGRANDGCLASLVNIYLKRPMIHCCACVCVFVVLFVVGCADGGGRVGAGTTVWFCRRLTDFIA